MKDTDLMEFGKHEGKALANVPADYLLWLYDNNRAHGDLKKYIEYNMDVLKKQAKK